MTVFITLRSFYPKLVFLFLSCLISSVAEETNSTSLSELELAKRDAKDFKNLATLIKPSVVVIESVDRNGYEGGRGTGFVVREDGVIATNFHVIGEHRDFSVRLTDGRTFAHIRSLRSIVIVISPLSRLKQKDYRFFNWATRRI